MLDMKKMENKPADLKREIAVNKTSSIQYSLPPCFSVYYIILTVLINSYKTYPLIR